jgi:hypothetical protein
VLFRSTHLATLLDKLSAHPQILRSYEKNIQALDLRSGVPEICDFLYGLVKETRPPRKKTVGDALRDIRERMIVQGEAMARRRGEKGIVRTRKRVARSRVKAAAKNARAAATRTKKKPAAAAPKKRGTTGPAAAQGARRPTGR